MLKIIRTMFDAMSKTENPNDLQQMLDRLYDATGSMDIKINSLRARRTQSCNYVLVYYTSESGTMELIPSFIF